MTHNIQTQVTEWVKVLPKENVLAWIDILKSRKVGVYADADMYMSVADLLFIIVNNVRPITEQEARHVAASIADFTFLELPAELRSHN